MVSVLAVFISLILRSMLVWNSSLDQHHDSLLQLSYYQVLQHGRIAWWAVDVCNIGKCNERSLMRHRG
jgi:hypothetical protein